MFSLTVEIYVSSALAVSWKVDDAHLAAAFGIHCVFVDDHVTFSACEVQGVPCNGATTIEYSTEDDDGDPADAGSSKTYLAMPALTADTTVTLRFASVGSPGPVSKQPYSQYTPFALLLAAPPDSVGNDIHANPAWTFASSTAFHNLG